MMSLEIFLLGLLIVSTLTGLFTEAIKKWLDFYILLSCVYKFRLHMGKEQK